MQYQSGGYSIFNIQYQSGGYIRYSDVKICQSDIQIQSQK